MCGGQWLPCAWRDRCAGGGVVPHPRPPPPPVQLGGPEPAAPARPKFPPASLGPSRVTCDPERGRRRLSAQLRRRPRPPRAPPARNPAPGLYANAQVSQPMVGRAGPALPGRSQWTRAGTGRRAHCRAAPRGRGRRVPFRTSAWAGPPPAGRLRRSEAARRGAPSAGGWYDPRRSPARPGWKGPGAYAPSAPHPQTGPPRAGHVLGSRRAPARAARAVRSRPPSTGASCTHSGAVCLAGRGCGSAWFVNSLVVRAHCIGAQGPGPLGPVLCSVLSGHWKGRSQRKDRFSPPGGAHEAAEGSMVLGRALYTSFSAAPRQNHGSLGSLVRQRGAWSPFVLHSPVWRVMAGVPPKQEPPDICSLSHPGCPCKPSWT